MNKRWKNLGALALVIALVVGGGFLVNRLFFAPRTFTAIFESASGIYPGDEVRVSGVKVGTIDSITPEGTQARLTLKVDRKVPVPEEAKAVIVAQNLVAARFVQLAPAYRGDGPTMADGTEIPKDRTAVPVEWDKVKTQLMRMATELGPRSGVEGTSVSRVIESAANALEGNGPKLNETIKQLSGVSRVLAEGSGNIVDIITNLQLFVTALRDSDQQVMSFQNRLATLTSLVDGSRSDLDSALVNLSAATVEVQRFVSGTRDKTVEQVQRLSNVTQNLVDNQMNLKNILHIAPNAFINAYNIYNPDTGSAVGQFVFNNMASPLQFICGAVGAVSNVTGPESAKLCAQYLGPALRLANFNTLPFPIAPFLMPSASPENIVYSEPGLAPGGGGGSPTPPEQPLTVSAYDGVAPGPAPFTGRAPGEAPPGIAQQLPGGPYSPPNVPASVYSQPNSVPALLNPGGGQ